MTTEPTFCEDCDWVGSDSRKQHPGRWVCLKFPRLTGFSPVAPNRWVEHEPYNRCVNINLGFCPLWTPKRDGKVPE